ncbi:LuxR C-terminal-related transcriptional regulator [Brevibacterium aurantiacum]|uniref:GAF domain-containing protein n=1 Tax=Brevibacterium aurantiacum TaxID=273384 RepID=A0A4Z0KEM5_BREAU|nr:LuxR C-terminal-related transcriptional regulator [Brevibacterium aurantiacum]TGD37060.1 GAF domain-containing protein [Brevibacterium aurantiacum]
MFAADSTIAAVRRARLRANRETAFVGPDDRKAIEELHSDLRTGLSSRDGSELVLTQLAAVAEERHAIAATDLAVRREVSRRISAAFARLRALPSSDEISRRAPAELRGACGFTRVMISSARGSRWLPDMIRPGADSMPDSDEFERFAQDGNEIPLARMMLETEMVRRRVPIMVEHAEADPRTYKPLIRVTGSDSYIAAPISTNRRVIGFLHADRQGQANPLTSGDLDSLTRFASGFGVLFESAVLRERLEVQRRRAADLFAEASGELSDLAGAPLSAFPQADDSNSSVDPHRRRGAVRSDRLTEREREVLTLLSTGASNRAIARELFVSSETVKSHVTNVMRKFKVSSRSAAVAQYLQLHASDENRHG